MAARPRRASLVLLAALAACAAPPPAPFEPPPLQPAWTHHAGSLLTGPQTGETPPDVDADPAHALALQVRLIALADLPPDELPRLASSARLVVGDTPGRTLQSVVRLASGALLAEGEPAKELLSRLDQGELSAATATAAPPTALPPGTTAVLSLPFTPPAAGPLTEARLLVSRGDSLAVALLLRGALPPEDEEAGGPPVISRELVVLQTPLPEDGTPLLLALPLARAGYPRAALLAVLTARPAPAGDEAFVQAVTAAVQSALTASRERRAATSELTSSEAFLREVISAFGVLSDATAQRSALSFLAGASDAPLCGDLVLLADAELLARLSQRIEEGGRDLTTLVAQGGGLGWLLERSALELLGSESESQPLPDELKAILFRQVGELGRYPGALMDMLPTCSSTTALRARVVQENRAFLEDSTTSARVRAFDWLAVRGLAPRGFDPLAPLAARRAALAAAEAEAAGVPAGDAR